MTKILTNQITQVSTKLLLLSLVEIIQICHLLEVAPIQDERPLIITQMQMQTQKDQVNNRWQQELLTTRTQTQTQTPPINLYSPVCKSRQICRQNWCLSKVSKINQESRYLRLTLTRKEDQQLTFKDKDPTWQVGVRQGKEAPRIASREPAKIQIINLLVIWWCREDLKIRAPKLAKMAFQPVLLQIEMLAHLGVTIHPVKLQALNEVVETVNRICANLWLVTNSTRLIRGVDIPPLTPIKICLHEPAVPKETDSVLAPKTIQIREMLLCTTEKTNKVPVLTSTAQAVLMGSSHNKLFYHRAENRPKQILHALYSL